MTFLKVKRKRAFSLVVSLVMMAFMLLIAIAVVAFVVVQSRLTEYKTKRFQAQNNAITGLRVALSQLQLLTGDDQRVTATADILGDGSNKSLKQGLPADGKRYWTGVWATGGLDKSKVRDWSIYNPNDKPFLGWLVSNEVNGISTPLDLPVSPESALSGSGRNLLKEATKGLKVDSEKVLLVDAGSLSSKSDASKINNLYARQVYASRIQMGTEISRTGISKFGGSYAYWVGDEGVKARVNLVDSYGRSGKSEFNGLTDWDRGFRSVAQRNGVEKITGLEDFFSWWQKDVSNNLAPYGKNTLLSFVGSPKGLSLYAKGNSGVLQIENTQRLFHDISFSSKSVLSDIYNGGLKTDLSLAFEMPWFSGDEDGWNNGFRDILRFHNTEDQNNLNLASRFNYTSGRFPLERYWIEQKKLGFAWEVYTKEDRSPNGLDSRYMRGPTWDVLRNHYRLYKREIEEDGFRGLKTSANDSFIARPSTPYSFASGEEGGNDKKFNINALTKRFFTPNPRFGYLPEFNGTNHPTFMNLTGAGDGGLPMLQSGRLSPILLRFFVGLGLAIQNNELTVVFEPSMTFFNPYSVPIDLCGYGLWSDKLHFFKINLQVYANGENITNQVGGGNGFVFNFTNEGGGSHSFQLRYFNSGDMNGNASDSSFMLEPGAVKVAFPYSYSLQGAGGNTGNARILASFNYDEGRTKGYPISNGLLTRIQNYIDRNATGDASPIISFKVKMDSAYKGDWNSRGAGGYIDTNTLTSHIFYPQTSQGALASKWHDNWAKANINDDDTSNESTLQRIHFKRYSIKNTTPKTTEYLLQDLQAKGTDPSWVGFLDVWRQASNESLLASPLLANPRAYLSSMLSFNNDLRFNFSPDNEESQLSGRAFAVGWGMKVIPANGPSDTPGNYRQFTGANNGYGFWGDSIRSDGQTHVVLYEVPERPLISLGSLQHIDATMLDFEPGYVVGNSYPPLGFKKSEMGDVFYWPSNSGTSGTDDSFSARPQPYLDHCFVANLNLFDTYYFSGINYGRQNGQEKTIDKVLDRLLLDKSNVFANGHIEYFFDSNKTEDTLRMEFKDPEKISKNLLLQGGFNINSTSIEAWKATLSGLNEQYVRIEDNFKRLEDIPFLKFMHVIGAKLGGFTNVKTGRDGDKGKGWRWYRSLTDKEINQLSERIVKEIRLRGPFMSLADFVNRRLETSGEAWRSGVLQTAIDDLNLNSKDESKSLSNKRPNDADNRTPSIIPNSKAGSTAYLTQADILTSVGNTFTARSDTFTIRVYGDTFGFSGSPESRVWCEAIVQRTPDYIVKDEKEDVIILSENYRSQQDDKNQYIYNQFERNPQANPVNKLLGRRYKIISFHWLSQNEI